MRNLKRVLSLALATAMLLGMMVVGASAADKKTAADLTDSSKISNKEAVTLLVDLGIIEGKTDGSYGPTETVNRATMAKLITMMMLGDVDQSSFKGTTTDLTDISGHWAEGYIKYCYANGIISGDGMGHFFPEQEVTVVQAAKMLLVAVGYDSADRGYTGGSWSINTMRDAQSATEWDIGSSKSGVTRALTKGLNIKSTDPLSRDNAAQMIFNTLFVTNKKPVFGWDMGKQFISSYSDQPSLAATTYNNLTRVVGVLDSVNVTAKSAVIGGATVKLSAETGDIGSTVVYYKAGSPLKPLSTAAVPTTAEVLATSTNGTAFTKLLTRGQTGYLGLTLDDNVSIYVNGTKAITDTYTAVDVATSGDGIYYTPDTTPTTGDYARLLAVGEAKDAIGDIIDFLDADNNGKVDTIKITEYTLSVVTKTTAAKADGTEATISIKGVSGTIDESLVVGDFAAFAKDDVILYAKIGDMYYVNEPKTFEGSVSRYNSGANTVVIGGTTYSVAGTPNLSGKTTANGATFGTGDSVFYADNNGYIVAFDGVSVATKYAVVDAIAYVKGAGATPNGYFEAKLIFSDGTTQVVKVNKLGGYTLLAANGTDVSTTNGRYDDTSAINFATNTKINTDATKNFPAFGNAIYTYKVDSNNNYDLTMKGVANSGMQISKGNANVSGLATANNDTVYVYKTTGTKDVITVYTGYKNAPTTSATAVVSYVAKGGYAGFVFVTDAAASVGDRTTNVIIFLATEGVENNADGTQTWLYKASVNGVVDTYKADSAQSYTDNTPYDVDVDNNGKISGTGTSGAYVAASGYISGNATANASNGTLKTNATIAAASPLPSISNAAFTFDGSETVYFVGGKDVVAGSASDIQAGMFFYVKTVDTTTVAGRIAMKTVYVLTPNDATPSTQGAITETTLTSGTLIGGNATLTATASGTIRIQVANTASKYTNVTISGAGTTVSNASTTTTAADATYTMVDGDTAGKVLTVTVMTSEPGKGIVTNVYNITLV